VDQYKKYKPSGIDWIGEIPDDWEIKRLKYLSEIVMGKMLTSENIGGSFLKPYLRAANLQWLRVDVSDIKEMWFSQKEIDKLRLEKNDLLVSEGGEVGRTSIWQNELDECYLQNSVHRVRFFIKNDPVFFLYQFFYLGSIGYFESIVNRISIGHLTGEKVKEIPFRVPSPKEQTAIADYLDKKTAQIDEFISKKQKLIELLKEERTAIINEAVSGEGKNWERKKLKYVAKKVQTGSTPPSNEGQYYIEELNWFTPSDFSENLLLENSKRKISQLAVSDGVVKMFPANSVLFVGIGATLGKVGYIIEPATSNQQINCLSFSTKEEAIFYANYFYSNQPNIVSLANAATLAILNQTQMKDIIVPVPASFNETKRIISYIQTETQKIGNTISRIEKEIELMQEYRTALISEVVTGKVKV
jgi:type I restriction enzyme S subunit